jgi:hypothetical protein
MEFQIIVDQMLASLGFVTYYIDDIIAFSLIPQDYMQHL